MNLQQYLQKHYSSSSTAMYEREIEIFVSNNPGNRTYKHADITAYVGLLRTRYKNPKTLKRVLSAIKVWYSFLVEKGEREDHPARAIRLRDSEEETVQLQDLFTSEELELLLIESKERYSILQNRNQILLSLLIYQGLKPGELEALETKDIDLDKGTINVKENGKNNGRILYLKSNQKKILEDYLETNRSILLSSNESEKLLVGQRGRAMSGEDITKHIQRRFKNVFAPRVVTARSIRQSVITNLLKDGKDISLVQYFAGHKYPSATEKYRQTQLKALSEAIQRLHPNI